MTEGQCINAILGAENAGTRRVILREYVAAQGKAVYADELKNLRLRYTKLQDRLQTAQLKEIHLLDKIIELKEKYEGPVVAG